jgi:hypothetical protein
MRKISELCFKSTGNFKQILERRRFERFRVEIPATVELMTPGGCKELVLKTSEISANGAYFPYRENFSAGCSIRMNFILEFPESGESNRAGKIMLITVNGTILRVDDAGTAVSFNQDYQIASICSRQSRSKLH